MLANLDSRLENFSEFSFVLERVDVGCATARTSAHKNIVGQD
jgi:hypothetical protein